jgi:hypothetical protein
MQKARWVCVRLNGFYVTQSSLDVCNEHNLTNLLESLMNLNKTSRRDISMEFCNLIHPIL